MLYFNSTGKRTCYLSVAEFAVKNVLLQYTVWSTFVEVVHRLVNFMYTKKCVGGIIVCPFFAQFLLKSKEQIIT